MSFDDYIQQGTKFLQEEKFDPALYNLEKALSLLQKNNTEHKNSVIEAEIKNMINWIKVMMREKSQSTESGCVTEIKYRTAALGVTDWTLPR